jgi:hypothetical protein
MYKKLSRSNSILGIQPTYIYTYTYFASTEYLEDGYELLNGGEKNLSVSSAHPRHLAGYADLGKDGAPGELNAG